MRAGSLTMAVLAVGLLAGCSGGDNGNGGFMNMGGLMGGSDHGSSDRRMASDAVDACAAAVKRQGWDVEKVGHTEPSGVNNVNVDMKIQQQDGDHHDITCIYDTGKQTARLQQ